MLAFESLLLVLAGAALSIGFARWIIRAVLVQGADLFGNFRARLRSLPAVAFPSQRARNRLARLPQFAMQPFQAFHFHPEYRR